MEVEKLVSCIGQSTSDEKLDKINDWNQGVRDPHEHGVGVKDRDTHTLITGRDNVWQSLSSSALKIWAYKYHPEHTKALAIFPNSCHA
jgi:hypothetical protein